MVYSIVLWTRNGSSDSSSREPDRCPKTLERDVSDLILRKQQGGGGNVWGRADGRQTMHEPITGKAQRRSRQWLDLAALFALAFIVETAHFAWRDGRPFLSGDSAQYVDAARALTDPSIDPNFAVRKPGYPLILAGIGSTVGYMGWVAVLLNHLLQAFVPLGVYGFGCILRSRLVGFVAALLTVAQMLGSYRADRIMTESVYMFLLTFGALALTAGLKWGRATEKRPNDGTVMGFTAQHASVQVRRALLAAGLLLGAAWLVRSIAIIPILLGAAFAVFVFRARPRRAIIACLLIISPFLAAATAECALNLRYGGAFRTSTGSLGLMLMMRTRYVQGLAIPDTAEGQRLLGLLPEREAVDAYRASEVDAWIARYHAVHDEGLTDWETDRLMRRGAWQMIEANPGAFAQTGGEIFVRYLSRRQDGSSIERVPPGLRKSIIRHPTNHEDDDYRWSWYADWALPHRTHDASLASVAQTKADAQLRAPYMDSSIVRVLRYWSMTPLVGDLLGVLRGLASIWPGFALLLCGPLRLHRPTCLFIALAYVLEAALMAVVCPSGDAVVRYQSVWMGIDTVLAAALITAPFERIRSASGRVLRSVSKSVLQIREEDVHGKQTVAST